MEEKILKKDLNPNIHLGEENMKSKNTDDVAFLTWSLPSQITCPYATEMCKKRCFSKKREIFKNVRDSRQRNLQETKKNSFVEDMIKHLKYQLQRKKMKDKKIFVRIHTSGDFYNLDYLIKWTNITEHFKNNDKILFQAYTKSMPIIVQWLWREELSGIAEWDIPPIGGGKILKDNINIHFVWSVWNDTPKEYAKHAEELGMQTFTALPKDKIEEAVNNGSFLCKGDCGNCKQCYTDKIKSIVIPYH
ncbi:hypothetical protein K144316041_p20870 (plasmid) [Clostridium tetani]|uniref:GP88 family protein n=1 Tax=Clostridium tetani TaxID=1513 RepID=UPI002953C3BC|nr:hypothetical protein [Clostridium tetani]BDR74248.1 hypothetical protein K144316041_p20870 [Clostridium tetani]